MPTYDYQCRSCGVITEVVHSMLEDGPSICERCGGPLRPIVHPSGIIFRGSGFYKTDSRSSSSGSAGGNRSGTAPSKDASPTTAPTDAGSSDKGSGQPPSGANAPKSGSD